MGAIFHDRWNGGGLKISNAMADYGREGMGTNVVGRAEVFVGRERELGTVADALATPSLSPSLVSIEGAAGIGKTALARHAITAWQDTKRRVLWTRCWHGTETPALRPWRHLLDALAGCGDLLDGAADRFGQFTAVGETFADASKVGDLLLVIDDLQWADQTSLELLHFLSRSTDLPRLCVLATMRVEDVEAAGSTGDFDVVLREATRVSLSGLQPASVRAMFADAEPANAEELHALTGGNPFFVSELLRVDALGTQSDHSAIPSGIRSVVERHLDLLDNDAVRALELAAVQGLSFDIDVTADAGQLDPLELGGLLKSADRLQLLRVNQRHAEFEHGLIRETLLDRLDPHVVAGLHERTATAIEKRSRVERDDAEAIANHLWAAGPLVTTDRMIASARAAADSAGRRLAWESQSLHLERALSTLRSAGDPDPGLVVDLLIDRCRTEKARRQLDAARDLALEAADLARSMHDNLRFAEVALVYPPDAEGIELDQVRDADQLRLRAEALQRVPEDAPKLRARLQGAHALALYWAGADRGLADQRRTVDTTDERDALTRAALETAEDLGDSGLLAEAIRARLYATWGPATQSTRTELAERLVSVAGRHGDMRLVLQGLVWRISHQFATGDFVGAEREIARLSHEADRLHDRVHQWTALRLAANLAFMQGDLPGCLETNGKALALGKAFLPDNGALQFYSAALGPLVHVTGQMGDNVAYVAEQARKAPHLPSWRIGHALCAAEANDLVTARRELEVVAADDFAMVPRDLDFLSSMMVAAAVAQRTGAGEIARRIAGHLQPISGQFAIHGIGYTSYGAVDLWLAQCADAAGDIDDADRLYSAAIEQLEPTGSPFEAFARLHRGRLRSTHGPASARPDLSAAIEQFERFRADAMLSRAQAALDELDQRSAIVLHQRDGAWFLVPFGESPVRLADLKGWRALHTLVSSPHQHHHALELAAVIENGTAAVRGESRVEVADEEAIRQYRRRIESLREQAQDADARGDAERSAALHHELDEIVDELRRTTGLGGRIAWEASNAGRARVNVTKHVKRVINRLFDIDRAVGQHLRDTVSTGMYCVYEPTSDDMTRRATPPVAT